MRSFFPENLLAALALLLALPSLPADAAGAAKGPRTTTGTAEAVPAKK